MKGLDIDADADTGHDEDGVAGASVHDDMMPEPERHGPPSPVVEDQDDGGYRSDDSQATVDVDAACAEDATARELLACVDEDMIRRSFYLFGVVSIYLFV